MGIFIDSSLHHAHLSIESRILRYLIKGVEEIRRNNTRLLKKLGPSAWHRIAFRGVMDIIIGDNSRLPAFEIHIGRESICLLEIIGNNVRFHLMQAIDG